MWSTTSPVPRKRSARAACRRRWRIVWLSASSALLLAACGGAERGAIPPDTAEALAVQSDRVAAALTRGDRCEADELADELVRDSAAAPLPADYREELLVSARALADSIECPPPPAVTEEDEDDDEGRGKGKGRGKKDDDD